MNVETNFFKECAECGQFIGKNISFIYRNEWFHESCYFRQPPPECKHEDEFRAGLSCTSCGKDFS